MERLDQRAIKRISGPSWQALKANFEAIHAILISTTPTAHGTLTTIYIKYAAPETDQKPFAVVWIKKSTELIVGLALPGTSRPPELTGPPPGCKYAGLTGYFKILPKDTTPKGFEAWARMAYEHTKTQQFSP